MHAITGPYFTWYWSTQSSNLLSFKPRSRANPLLLRTVIIAIIQLQKPAANNCSCYLLLPACYNVVTVWLLSKLAGCTADLIAKMLPNRREIVPRKSTIRHCKPRMRYRPWKSCQLTKYPHCFPHEFVN